MDVQVPFLLINHGLSMSLDCNGHNAYPVRRRQVISYMHCKSSIYSSPCSHSL